MSTLRRIRRDLEFVSIFGRVLGPGMRILPTRKVDYSDMLAEHFQRRPDQPALIGESSRMTWGELDRDAYATLDEMWREFAARTQLNTKLPSLKILLVGIVANVVWQSQIPAF